MRSPLQWEYMGLCTRWMGRQEYGYVEPATFVEVYQKWKLRVLGVPVYVGHWAVGEIDINQWIARVPMGECSLTPEQIRSFSPR